MDPVAPSHAHSSMGPSRRELQKAQINQPLKETLNPWGSQAKVLANEISVRFVEAPDNLTVSSYFRKNEIFKYCSILFSILLQISTSTLDLEYSYQVLDEN